MSENMTMPMTIIKIALGLLAERAIALLTLVMTFALFAWAIQKENISCMAAAAGFALLVLLPVLLKAYPKQSGGST